MLILVKEPHKDPAVYIRGRLVDGIGYSDCTTIVEHDGKRIAMSGTWVPALLIVATYEDPSLENSMRNIWREQALEKAARDVGLMQYYEPELYERVVEVWGLFQADEITPDEFRDKVNALKASA